MGQGDPGGQHQSGVTRRPDWVKTRPPLQRSDVSFRRVRTWSAASVGCRPRASGNRVSVRFAGLAPARGPSRQGRILSFLSRAWGLGDRTTLTPSEVPTVPSWNGRGSQAMASPLSRLGGAAQIRRSKVVSPAISPICRLFVVSSAELTRLATAKGFNDDLTRIVEPFGSVLQYVTHLFYMASVNARSPDTRK